MDLIPRDYHEQLKLKGWCRDFGIAYVLVILAIVLLKADLARRADNLQREIDALQQHKIANTMQQNTFESLNAEANTLQKRVEILDGLRGGVPVRRIFLAFDEVLNEDVWFTLWTFRRAGEITDVKPETVRTGYFIVIPQGASQSNRQQAWKLDTHMEIAGQAINHSALAALVRRLIDRPEIHDVKVLDTTLRNYGSTQVVNFSLAVIVNNHVH